MAPWQQQQQQRRPTAIGRKPPLRLEGLVIQKRLTHVEATRYLVMDMNAGSISFYKKPPPKDDDEMQQRSKSVPTKMLESMTPKSLKRSSSDEGGKKAQVTCENLAHISRTPRHFDEGVWEPKFSASSAIDWKIR